MRPPRPVRESGTSPRIPAPPPACRSSSRGRQCRCLQQHADIHDRRSGRVSVMAERPIQMTCRSRVGVAAVPATLAFAACRGGAGAGGGTPPAAGRVRAVPGRDSGRDIAPRRCRAARSAAVSASAISRVSGSSSSCSAPTSQMPAMATPITSPPGCIAPAGGCACRPGRSISAHTRAVGSDTRSVSRGEPPGHRTMPGSWRSTPPSWLMRMPTHDISDAIHLQPDRPPGDSDHRPPPWAARSAPGTGLGHAERQAGRCRHHAGARARRQRSDRQHRDQAPRPTWPTHGLHHNHDAGAAVPRRAACVPDPVEGPTRRRHLPGSGHDRPRELR